MASRNTEVLVNLYFVIRQKKLIGKKLNYEKYVRSAK